MSAENKKAKITVPEIIKMKQNGEKVTMLTAYDALMAEIIDVAGTDIILVGDSGGMVMGGKENTLSVTMDEMVFYTKSVSRGVQNALLVADMPFLSYQVSTEKAIENAGRFLQEACAEAVKIEGGEIMAETISRLVSLGIPVMGHLGLTPQSMHQLGGFKIQGTKSKSAESLLKDAKILEEAGAFSIVLEKIPAKLAKEISDSISIPTIGIGAGAGCDGQVLVTQDMLGIFRKFKPKFVRRYAELGDEIEKSCRAYIKDVKNSSFPSENESY
ncbi:MAG: 3-methyl-2-oxobutanoate hydroxymethyltransferase [Calditrichaeota bacterium]|nr:MAG: 3-methyl-2-oxobutanoate hydroxymethyltransferase [Calditrichota bacterium]MBL1204709.1 3-methyl-2-oxobutanoate hydroxymethyltransferase [Calditrichota bacterium]NOG44537.1 3-methyl-2-oxobutanoate hydroxymethyltransferase [Calditrichota bacterium]